MAEAMMPVKWASHASRVARPYTADRSADPYPAWLGSAGLASLARRPRCGLCCVRARVPAPRMTLRTLRLCGARPETLTTFLHFAHHWLAGGQELGARGLGLGTRSRSRESARCAEYQIAYLISHIRGRKSRDQGPSHISGSWAKA